MRSIFISAGFLCLLCSTAAPASELLEGRVELNWRYGYERSILMTEFWVPIVQDEGSVLYGDLRLMGDDQDNREGNLGLGYRRIVRAPLLGEGVAGVNGWLDRRITGLGSAFHQMTAGAEWFGDEIDIRANAYLPLSDEKSHVVANPDAQGPAFTGTGIVVDTPATVLEEPQSGFDLELGWEMGQNLGFVRDHTDSVRVYGGGYYFNGDHAKSVAGWRTRIAADISENVQIGARFQRDHERGSQGFLEATIRFPFGQKKSFRREGLRARLDESPERDIDIVTGSAVTDSGDRVAVLNAQTGQPQDVLHVDNTAAPGGDGSAEAPFDTLTAAEAAAQAQSIIYMHEGDGTATGQDQGLILDDPGQRLIGAGADFVYDGSRFTTANGADPLVTVLAPATSAPVLSNVNANGDGVTVTADDVTVEGVTVDGASRDGIVVSADGAGTSAQNVTIRSVTARNNRHGIYIHGANDGSVSASVLQSVASTNSQHGMVVYDDTDGTFIADLGGGSLGSAGLNVLAGNTLEDLAVEYDGRTLAAKNNWWGQASGPDENNPSDGLAPQIYYGAPLNDGLIGHWTLNTEWIDGTQAYDRTALSLNGDIKNAPLPLAGQKGEALEFDGNNDYIEVARNVNLEPTSAVTASAWIYWNGPASGDYQKILNKAKDTFSNPYQSYSLGVDEDTQRIQFEVTVNGTRREATATVDAPLDAWLFVTGTWEDGDRVRIYYDDQEIGASSVYNGSITYYNSPFAIGRSSNGEEPTTNFDGAIDDARIYNRALSVSEISEVYRMDTASEADTSGALTAAP
jgi:hypothetical protein